MFPHATCLLWSINNRRTDQPEGEDETGGWVQVTGGSDGIHCSIRTRTPRPPSPSWRREEQDPQKFEEWRQALPKHRPLAKHDRVCEKHFKSSDILRDWTYQIEGKTRKLLRSKPILQPDAIPCIFSVCEPDTASTVSTARRRKKKSPEPSEESNSVVVVVESTNQPLEVEPIGQEEQSVLILINNESTNPSKQDAASGENKVVELIETEMDIIEKESIFEELYDNIFEVELPSTLWGVHREPDRKFVAFSRFEWREQDVNAARSISLLVDCSLGCRAWYDGKLVFSNDLTSKLVSRSDDKGNPTQLTVPSRLK
uniref:THAP-type domain-containing protein n=1 Tax=Anopheles culicifacies TaxID=139723 RepID=A0A182M708_9DIPT